MSAVNSLAQIKKNGCKKTPPLSFYYFTNAAPSWAITYIYIYIWACFLVALRLVYFSLFLCCVCACTWAPAAALPHTFADGRKSASRWKWNRKKKKGTYRGKKKTTIRNGKVRKHKEMYNVHGTYTHVSSSSSGLKAYVYDGRWRWMAHSAILKLWKKN